MWKRGRWVQTAAERVTGAGVAPLLEELGWSRTRLACELDTRQQSISQWASQPDRRLSVLATYTLRAVRRKYAAK